VLHFGGHGTGEQGIALIDSQGNLQLISTADMGEVLDTVQSNQGCIECVVLNACHSEVQAKELTKYVPYVVGMSDAIGDDVAVRFAQGFYQALAKDYSYESAFK